METPSNTNQPMDYVERKGKTPTSVLVVSILGILFSAFILLCAPVSVLLVIMPWFPNPVLDALRQDKTYVAFLLATNGLNMVLGLWLLASSIGSLKLKPWARVGMNVYAVAYAVTTVAGTAFSVAYVLPRTKAALEAAGVAGGASGMTQTVVSVALGLLFALAVAGVILVVFNRKVAVDAFKGIFPAEVGNYPGEMGG